MRMDSSPSQNSPPLPPDVDVRLLRCLLALVMERHVTRAAEAVGMSQSGMSTALARLRVVFNDPLLIRTPQGMRPTEHALHIEGNVRRALNELDGALIRFGDFDPLTSDQMFTVMASDYVSMMLLPHVLGDVRTHAPGVTLKVVPPEPVRIREALANGEVDLVVGFYMEVAATLYQTTLNEEQLVGVSRVGHPALTESGRISRDQYAQARHVYYGAPPASTTSLEFLLARILPPLGIERRIGVYLPSLSAILRVVAETDLIATVPRTLAQHYLVGMPLQLLALPFDAPPTPIQALWHERVHTSSANVWLRDRFRSAGRRLS